MRYYLRRPLGRVRAVAWPVAQAAVAAGVAWALAQAVLGHTQPVFAAIAAVVALAANVGGRGRQAVEMLFGVGVGVAVGELLVLVLGAGAPQVALATAVAMLVMAAVVNSVLPLIQAGTSAVLVVALQSPGSGGGRVLDALVGAGVALLISQVLFPPSPVSLLKGAAREVLRPLAEGLRAGAQALASGDGAAARAALERLRAEEQSAMSGLAMARETSAKVARRTLRGRREAEWLGQLDVRVGKLDLLSGSVTFLSRASCRLLNERVAPPGWLVPAIRELARALEALAEDPESPDARRRASDAAAVAAREAARGEDLGVADPRVTLAAEGIRLAASDIAKLTAPEEAGLEPTA